VQTNLFEAQRQRLDMQDADVEYIANWLNPDLADKLFSHFSADLAWQEAHIAMFGRQVKIPRLQAWYGDPDAVYKYSGLQMQPVAWTPNLLTLKHRCEHECGVKFNSVLANLYRSGSDSMGFHSDNEPELGNQPVIASVSLGQARNFDFKHTNTQEKVRLVLEHGSLLVMSGDTQRYWQHGINKTKRTAQPRINFTFRSVKVI